VEEGACDGKLERRSAESRADVHGEDDGEVGEGEESGDDDGFALARARPDESGVEFDRGEKGLDV
jgi:hypothetical protein